MILSLPDLKTVSVTLHEGFPRQPLSTSIMPQRRSLEFLRLYLYANGVVEVLIRSRFTFRTIWLGGSISSIRRLLAVSSETLVTGMPAQLIDLPSFPVLTSIRVFCGEEPSRRIVKVLSSICPTPVLTLIYVKRWSPNIYGHTPSDTWNDLDRWLARVGVGVESETMEIRRVILGGTFAEVQGGRR